MANEKKIAKIFKPWRKSDNEIFKVIEDDSTCCFRENWWSSYFFFQGEAGADMDDFNIFRKLIMRPYLVAWFLIAQTMEENADTGRKQTTDCKGIATYIGANDYLMPLIPLSLLCVTAARLMHIKCLDLQGEGKIKTYRALKAAQVAFNIVVNIPLLVFTAPLCFVWDLAKAALSVIEATITACLWTLGEMCAEKAAERNYRSI